MTALAAPSHPTVLLSQATLQRLGDRWPAQAHALSLEEALAQPERTVDAVYISRDITGLSTKHELQQTLLDCYAVMRRSPELAWVHAHSAGADRPIYAELRARGVAVTVSAGANAAVVAQTALGGLLALARRFPQLMQAQRQHRWAPLVAGPLPRDLAGQQVLLVGWGRIAQTLHPWLVALGLRVRVVRREGHAPEPGVETVGYAALGQALPETDWLILACPLTDTTRGLIDAAALALLPRGAHLINVARGEVVDESALIESLRSEHLAGAFLDVFAHEPLPVASPLWDLPQVMVTPHAAGHSDGNAARVDAMFLDNLQRWLQGRALVQAQP